MILALDIATTVGVAIGPTGANPPLLRWGSRNFGGAGRKNGEVIGRFRHFLSTLLYKHKPTLVCFESPYIPHLQARGPRAGGPPPMNANTLRRLLGMVSAVEAACWELQIEYYEATPAEITKFFTGRARHGGRDAKKAAVIAMCRAYGWEVEDDDDAADALSLWAMCEAQINPRAAEARAIANPAKSSLFAENTNASRGQTARRPKKPADKSELSLWPETAQI